MSDRGRVYFKICLKTIIPFGAKNNKYLHFVAKTSTGKLFVLGLQDHFSGVAQSQLDGMHFFLDELANCIQEEECIRGQLLGLGDASAEEPIVHNTSDCSCSSCRYKFQYEAIFSY